MSTSNPSITLAKGAVGATLIGVIAVFLWASLALLTTLTAGIPAFQLLASSFAVAFVTSLCMLGLRGAAGFSSWRQPWPVWATGFAGIFVYHALYFFALKAAPAAEASLIAFLWPLLIVLLSSFATGESLRKRQLLGALLGLAGTAFIMQLRARNDSASMPVMGYAAAFACAWVWAIYSVFNRRFSHVPSSIIGGICGLVAVAGGLCHLAFETTVRPDPGQWGAIIGLGLGPVGLAFFAWDHATKHGNLSMLGALSYLAPLFSTLLLIAMGQSDARPILMIPAVLIISGAVIATSRSRATSG
ncbi:MULTISPECIES: aromatic amino acid exporter YddG [Pseudomonas]|jgi:drug/metabolite transporter (DMT)-like permease|uniref:DMT family transporter n=2 Tax=Pseudomonas TaxID=286 RepID=A0A4Y9TB12_PSEFL|nr:MULTISPECIES: DMT family transporter [Pseudomonas]CRM94597.1 Aromatic amino acid exporter YddG [Pseudomonas sp. 22 E 5]MCX9153255.1 DMT family transporter [Pseudomonas sp. TB1-B1]QXH67684.1 DMT family transporter [Pseudomonas asgharzadehiana]TFW40242.1 DMT family transporter [Pseudomonas fluorescens]TKJ56328.1 EamA/RhaT family transporter [Pseudomonas sp. CFBP13506]